MNTKFAATALILASSLIASTSFAYVPDRSDATMMRNFATSGSMAAPSTLTREQVRADVAQARADGSLALVNEGVKNVLKSAVKSAPSTVTREAVLGEYYAAQKAGTLPSTNEGA